MGRQSHRYGRCEQGKLRTHAYLPSQPYGCVSAEAKQLFTVAHEELEKHAPAV